MPSPKLEDVKYLSPNAEKLLKDKFERFNTSQGNFIINKGESSPVFKKNQDTLEYVFSNLAWNNMNVRLDKELCYLELEVKLNFGTYNLVGWFDTYSASSEDPLESTGSIKDELYKKIQQCMSSYNKKNCPLMTPAEYNQVASGKPISCKKYNNPFDAIPEIKDKNRLSELSAIVATMK